MSASQKLIGPMSLVWTLGVAVASVLFMAGALNIGVTIARWSDSKVAMALVLPASVVLGVWAWMLVLAGVWRLRRYYLDGVGTAVNAVVVESELQRRDSQGPLNFDLWRVQVMVQCPHPDYGADVRIQKQYFFPQFREAKARVLAERLAVGATVPVVVHKNAAFIDIPKRPVWADIW
ncbi:hypothetical protein ACFC06_22595 [Nocardia sp. NPDC056064]|uniref:hypothetical protein n=1 Tax=Nocardia sp. NPDC056064 TaxID=3345701 RepID=UPI0035E0DC35